MNPEAWIALVGLAITGGTALAVIAFRLGVLSNRVSQREKDADALAQRVTALDARTASIDVAMAAMRVLLENINVAVSGRKVQP